MKYLYALRDDLVSLLRESIIIQGTLTLMVVAAWLYMIVDGRTPPDLLNGAVALVMGFFFGSKLALRRAQFPEEPRRVTDGPTEDHRIERAPHHKRTKDDGK